MKNFKRFFEKMKGARIYYLIAMFSMVLSQIFSALTPVVVLATIDSIIDNKPFQYKTIEKLVKYIGGIEYVRAHLWLVAFALVFLAFIRCIFIFSRSFFASKSTEIFANNLRDVVYERLAFLDYKLLNEKNPGELLQRVTSDIDVITKMLNVQFVEILGSISLFVAAFVLMFSINTKLALVCVVTSILIAITSFLFFKIVKNIFKQVAKKEAILTNIAQESIKNIEVVKAFNKEGNEFEKFSKSNESFRKTQNKLMYTNASYWAFTNFLTFLQIGVIIMYGGYLAIHDLMTFGELVIFVTYVYMTIWPIKSLTRILTDTSKATVAMDRIEEILAFPIEDLEIGDKNIDIFSDIEYKDVSFKFSEDEDFVLKNISFKLKKGESLGITGPTGSGKSVLIELLPRLFDTNYGDIFIGEKNIKYISKKHLRKNIAIVLQEPYLYNKTIMQNLKIVNPNLSVTL